MYLPLIRDFTALYTGPIQLSQTREGKFGNIQVFDTPVAIAQKCSGVSVDGPQNLLLWIPLEPAVDVIGQQTVSSARILP